MGRIIPYITYMEWKIKHVFETTNQIHIYIYKIGYPAYLPIQALLHLMESFFGNHGKHGLEAPS
jgi:hypothetical protein